MPLEMAALCAFPWDFADRGVDTTLARCRDLGVTHVLLAVSYHAGWFLYPDNPVRRVHMLEDGVVYFHPHGDLYQDTPIRPQVASMSNQVGWVQDIAGRIGQFGLKLGTWTVFLHNTRLGQHHPECAVYNAFGDGYPAALCPSHPHVRAYSRALARDLVTHYPVDVLMIEAGDYRGRRHGGGWVAGHHHERDGLVLDPLEHALFEMSFAPTDLEAARSEGIDAEAVRRAVRDHLEDCLHSHPDRPPSRPQTMADFEGAVPALAAYRSCLARQAEKLVDGIRAEAAAVGTKLMGTGPLVDWVMAGAYGEVPSGVAAAVQKARSAARPQQKVVAGIRLGFNPPETGAVHSRAQLEQCVAAAAESGAEGVWFYNLAESPRRSVEWIRPALERLSRPAAPDLRLGVIGAGNIAEAYLRSAQRIGGMQVSAISATTAESARRRADQFGIPLAFANNQDLLQVSDTPAVLVTAPQKWHAEILRASLDAGKHVLMEKPLGLTLAEAEEMVDWALASDRVVGVCLVHRYLPFYRVARDLIQTGSLGRIRQIRVRTGRDIYTDPRFADPEHTRGGWLTRPEIAGGGITISSTIHLFSVCSFLLGDPRIAEVQAQVRRLHPRAYPGVEDEVTVCLATEDGAEILAEDSWSRAWPFEFEIQGDEGRFQASGPTWAGNVKLTGRLGGPVPVGYAALAGKDGFAINAARYADRCLPTFDGLLADFAASVRQGFLLRPLPDALHARNMQAVVEAVWESGRRKVAVPVSWRYAGQTAPSR